jgi:YD repeat-containing protein
LLIKGRLLDKKRHPATRRSAGGAITKPAGETIYFVYDVLGRLASKDVPNLRPFEADVSYGYDNLGALTSTPDELGHVQSFEHDVHGNLLAEHSNWYGSVRSQYDHGGRRTAADLAGRLLRHLRLSRHRRDGAIRENGGAVLASFGYDELGRRTEHRPRQRHGHELRLRRGVAAGDADAGARRRRCDAASDLPPQSGDADRVRDPLQRRYQWSGGGNGTTASTPNALNQIAATDGVAFSYDAKGNLTSDGTRPSPTPPRTASPRAPAPTSITTRSAARPPLRPRRQLPL